MVGNVLEACANWKRLGGVRSMCALEKTYEKHMVEEHVGLVFSHEACLFYVIYVQIKDATVYVCRHEKYNFPMPRTRAKGVSTLQHQIIMGRNSYLVKTSLKQSNSTHNNIPRYRTHY